MVEIEGLRVWLSLVPLEILTAVITAGLTILGIAFKERIDKQNRLKDEERVQLDEAKAYAAPLTLALVSLVHRLHQIFAEQAVFLSSKAPDNEYYNYMFRSTIYRLGSVLGWLRAANRALSGIEVSNQKDYTNINQAVRRLQSALAESEQLAETRLNFLTRLWNIPIDNIKPADAAKLAQDIEEIIWDALLNENANFAHELDEEKQIILLRKVITDIKETCQLDELDLNIVEKKRQSSITAISRIESWIYRDWQSAIGDMMLMPSRADNKLYEVIGFSRFEDLYLRHLNEGTEDNRWLERMRNLFSDLNLKRDQAFDARAQQLRDVCSTAIQLIKALESVDFGLKKVNKQDWNKLLQADKAYNPTFYKK